MTPVPRTPTATRGTARAVRRTLLALVLATALGAGVAQAAGQTVTTEGIAVRTVAPPCVPAWWDAAYDLRQSISVTTTTAVANDHSVSLTFDHAALVTGATSLASGNDVRVVALDTAACTWTELDRVVDDSSAWNTATTKLWFRLATAVGASSSSATAYYLYYDNPAAGAPPANASNVFLRYDDFPGNALGPAWTVLRAPTTWSVTGNALRITMGQSKDFTTTNNAPLFYVADPTGSVEVQMKLTSTYTANGPHAGILTYTDDANYVAVYSRYTSGARRTRTANEVAGVVSAAADVVGGASPMYLRLTRAGTTHTSALSTDGGASFTTHATQTVAITATSIGVTAFSTSTNTTTVDITDFRVRRTVTTEPALTLGAQVARY